MGISLWKTAGFFLGIVIFATNLFPSSRELGLLYSRSHFFDLAFFHLAKEFHEDPDDIPNAVRYLESLRYRQEFPAFERIGERLIAAHPANIALHEIMANFFEERMRLREAAAHWARMVDLKPKIETYREKLVSYYLLNKDFDALAKLQERMIDLDPVKREPYYELIRLRLLQRRAGEARRVCQRLLERYPAEAKARRVMAEIAEFEGDTGEALAVYRELAKSGKKTDAARLVRKLLQYKEEAEALGVLEVYVQRYPESRGFPLLLAELYEKAGRRTEARGILEALYQRDTENPRVLRGLGELYAEMQNYGEARRLLQKYHEKTGGTYHSHHVLGDVLAGLGDADGSRREYERALGLIRQRK